MKKLLPFFVLLCLLTVLLLTAPAGFALAAPAADEAEITGQLSILWGDGAPGSGLTQMRFILHTEKGAAVEVELPAADDSLSLNGQTVTLHGVWAEGSFLASELKRQSALSAAPAAVTGSQAWVTVLCKFKDNLSEPYPPAYFESMYGSVYPQLNHYWLEQSYGLMNVSGSRATARWYTLPKSRSEYGGASSFDKGAALNDCVSAADVDVNYALYKGINLAFNGELDGYAWGGSYWINKDGVYRTFSTTWLPPWGYQNISVIEHEMGHGFGLPHSAWNRSTVYDNRWDVMSDNWSDAGNAKDPTYGVLGQHTIAYHKDRLGWLNARKYTLLPTNRVSLNLSQLAQPDAAGMLLLQIPVLNKANLFYTVEVRRRIGYDRKLPDSAVIIHLVDTNQSIPAQLVTSNESSNLAKQEWLPGEVFFDPTNQIWVRVDAITANGFTLTAGNVAPMIDPATLTNKVGLPFIYSGSQP